MLSTKCLQIIYSSKKSKVCDFSRGWPEGFLLIATTPRYRGGDCSILRVSPFYPWSSPYNGWVLEKAASSTIFRVFSMTRPGIEPSYPGHFANTLLIRPMVHVIYHIIFMYKDDLVFNNQQGLICHKPNQTKQNMHLKNQIDNYIGFNQLTVVFKIRQ